LDTGAGEGDCLSEADAEKRTYAPFSFRAAVYQGLRRDRSRKLQLFKLQKAAFCKKISDAGFRVYSRFEEGGIIRYVLSDRIQNALLKCAAGRGRIHVHRPDPEPPFRWISICGSAENIRYAKSFL
jgi:hypothetical protein